MTDQYYLDELNSLSIEQLQQLRTPKGVGKLHYTVELALFNKLNPRSVERVNDMDEYHSNLSKSNPMYNALCDLCRKPFLREFKQTNICADCVLA